MKRSGMIELVEENIKRLSEKVTRQLADTDAQLYDTLSSDSFCEDVAYIRAAKQFLYILNSERTDAEVEAKTLSEMRCSVGSLNNSSSSALNHMQFQLTKTWNRLYREFYKY
jgi:hypothetical protein